MHAAVQADLQRFQSSRRATAGISVRQEEAERDEAIAVCRNVQAIRERKEYKWVMVILSIWLSKHSEVALSNVASHCFEYKADC